MNILYITWKSFGADDLRTALHNLGNSVTELELPEKAKAGYDEDFAAEVRKKIASEKIKLVVSFNYFSSVSEACMGEGCRYFSWIYDSPYVNVYDKSVSNNVNYVGTFDSFMADELNSQGVATVHYVPLAVNVRRVHSRIDKLSHAGADIVLKSGLRLGSCCGDISFVGSLYNDRNRFYERLINGSGDMELAGYLDALVEAQRKIYGSNFLDECIDGEILAKIRKIMPYQVDEGCYIDERRVYSDYYLGPRIAFLDRSEMLMTLAKFFKVDLFTYTDYKIDNVNMCGSLDYYEEMPLIFNRCGINLNISLRSIRTGIPLRAMDILGAAGFMLTNYQEDMFRHFEPGKHFDYYTSIEEAVDKADYYLRHDTERNAIAAAAGEEMEKNHTFEVRLREIISNICA